MSMDVIIRTKNSALTLDACLHALKRGVPCIKKIYVVDKHSSDGTAKIVERHGCIVIDSDLGPGQAQRLGAKLCDTDYFISLDSDIIIPTNFYQILEPYIKLNCITKGIYYDMLRPSEKVVSDRNFDWINRNVGSSDCCIIDRLWFLKISEDWQKRGIEGVEDTDTYHRCKVNGYPIHQDDRVVCKHYQFNVLRILRQTRWYGRNSRGWIYGLGWFYPLKMLGFPVMGLVEAFRWRSIKIFFYESAKMFFWFWGWFLR